MKGRNNERLCLGCNTLKDKSELIRIVSVGGAAKLSSDPKDEGRSAYLCNNPACIRKCIKTSGLKRGLKNTDCKEVYALLSEMAE